MRITPLASGSLGNSLLAEIDGYRLLIDAGLELSALEQRLETIGVRPGEVDALFLTHRHRDHVRAATGLARAHRVAVFATRRTARVIGTEARRRVRRIEPMRQFDLGPFRALALPVEHDAPETVALLLEAGGCRYGHVTDLGCTDGPIGDYLGRCDGLLLEFNHDAALLRDGRDPGFLKRRIASGRGHLSNDQAAGLLRGLAHERLGHVWLAHLSRRNNRPELALSTARAALGPGAGTELHVARQDEPSPAVDLRGPGPVTAGGRSDRAARPTTLPDTGRATRRGRP